MTVEVEVTFLQRDVDVARSRVRRTHQQRHCLFCLPALEQRGNHLRRGESSIWGSSRGLILNCMYRYDV